MAPRPHVPRRIDPRTVGLAVALALAVAALLHPTWTSRVARHDLTVVVDITTSMMVRDASIEGRPASRLDAAKRGLTDLVARLACGSRVALAVFSERRAFLLFEPVEVCSGYPAIAGTLDRLDWRMAWEGDSRISKGVADALEVAGSLDTDLVFVTDGHEAPPLRPDQPLWFPGGDGDAKRHGLLVGVGGDALSPIPKFDDDGHEVGFLAESDVPQDNRQGPPPSNAESRTGYNARNAPFGAEVARGNEHLSSLKQDYLEDLGRVTGLGYARLGRDDLAGAVARFARALPANAAADLRPLFGLAAFAALVLVYLVAPLAAVTVRRRRRGAPRSIASRGAPA